MRTSHPGNSLPLPLSTNPPVRSQQPRETHCYGRCHWPHQRLKVTLQAPVVQQVGREGILAHSIDGLFEFEGTAHNILHFLWPCLGGPWPLAQVHQLQLQPEQRARRGGMDGMCGNGRMRKIFDDMEAGIAFPPEPPAQPSGGGGGGGGGISPFAPASSSSAQSGSDSGGGMREEKTKATRRAQINALRYVQTFFLAASTCEAKPCIPRCSRGIGSPSDQTSHELPDDRSALEMLKEARGHDLIEIRRRHTVLKNVCTYMPPPAN